MTFSICPRCWGRFNNMTCRCLNCGITDIEIRLGKTFKQLDKERMAFIMSKDSPPLRLKE